MPRVRVKICISDNYVDLINKDLYEPVVLEIMNDSEKVFPDKYQRILNQSHGESDYLNLNTGQMIDAKLLFKEKQCYMLSQGKDKLQKWLDSLKAEVEELFELIKSDSKRDLNTSMLYFEMVQRLNSIKKGEDVVLFMPYPLAVGYKNGTVSYLNVNIFQMLFDNIKNNYPETALGKRVYVIYPSLDDRIILSELTAENYQNEYLVSGVLAEYVNMEIVG